MGLLFQIINTLQRCPQQVHFIYMNNVTYELLQDEIDNLTDEDYNYYASLGLETVSIAIDMSLDDQIFELH